MDAFGVWTNSTSIVNYVNMTGTSPLKMKSVVVVAAKNCV
jgi:hypothetical protein